MIKMLLSIKQRSNISAVTPLTTLIPQYSTTHIEQLCHTQTLSKLLLINVSYFPYLNPSTLHSLSHDCWLPSRLPVVAHKNITSYVTTHIPINHIIPSLAVEGVNCHNDGTSYDPVDHIWHHSEDKKVSKLIAAWTPHHHVGLISNR